ncbi:MAG: TRAP transporter substrate-binding protein [Lachnospiraceae bacterium]|nr:TRAP transporter substrate-binding protein [Lachnospiraceae bacterium]MBP5184040.1 TRAP transporter substrate-binding protein [Lachnospiraceae bacterium]
MKKRVLATVLVVVLALSSFIGCGKKEEGPLTLVYAEVNPQDTIVGQVAADFKAKVEELSKGQIIIDVQYSGVLGSENDVLDAMLAGAGSADISRISAFSLTSYGAEKSVLLSLPYTFESREHFWKFATSSLADEFLNESYEKKLGVKGLFYGEEGFRHFFTKNPVNNIGDLAGMKLRVSNDPVMNGLVKGLGASPTVVAFGELYSALSSGVVDGAEQPIANYKSNSFPEVANNMILDGHTLGAIEIVVATPVWDKLTKEQQDILIQAGKYAQENNKKNSQAKEDAVLKELKDNGCNVVEVKDLAPWQDAVKDVIKDNTKGLEDLYQKILNFK